MSLPDSALRAEIESLAALPAKLVELRTRRVELAKTVHEQLAKTVEEYRRLYGPVKEFVKSAAQMDMHLPLDFAVRIEESDFQDQFFPRINRQSRGSFAGVDESNLLMRSLLKEVNFGDVNSTLKFLDTIDDMLHFDRRESGGGRETRIADQLRKGGEPQDILDYLYGMTYLEPRYSLTFDGQEISQLSPGERGLLLLVFYLHKTFAAQRKIIDEGPKPDAGGGKGKPKLSFDALAGSDKQSGSDNAFQRFLAQVAKQDQLAQQQLDNGGKLAESDRVRIQLLADLADATKGFSDEQQKEGRVVVLGLEAKLKAFEGEQAMARSREAAIKLQESSVAVWVKEGAAVKEQNQRLAEHIEEMGLSADALDRLRITRLEDAKATEEQALMGLYLVSASEAEIDAAKRKIALMQEQINLTRQQGAKASAIAEDPLGGLSKALEEYVKEAQDVGDATYAATKQANRLLETDLVNSLKKGKLDVSQTVDFMIGEFLRLAVVKPMLSSLFDGAGSGGSASWLSGLFKMFGGTAANANGNAFGPGGVMPFANGGIVDSPTFFKFANGGALASGVMGEAGAEGILPLKRGPGGRLGVSMYGGGGTVIHVTNHNTIGSGVSRNEVVAAMEQTKRSTIAAIADAQRRGRQTA